MPELWSRTSANQFGAGVAGPAGDRAVSSVDDARHCTGNNHFPQPGSWLWLTDLPNAVMAALAAVRAGANNSQPRGTRRGQH